MTGNRWSVAAVLVQALFASLPSTTTCFTVVATASSSRRKMRPHHLPAERSTTTTSSSSSTTTRQHPDDGESSSSSSSSSSNEDENELSLLLLLSSATRTLKNHDESQRSYVSMDGSRGMGGGISAYRHATSLDEKSRASLRDAVRVLTTRANAERESMMEKSMRSSSSSSSSSGGGGGGGRIMLGICASNVPEALGGLKSWVGGLELPRGMLHGMDLDGVPIPAEDFGSVYVKYSTGGAMTFGEMRKSGRGFDALWRPGDALLETYDGDFRGVYLNVELEDGEFRQFGLLPTDLFMVEEDW